MRKEAANKRNIYLLETLGAGVLPDQLLSLLRLLQEHEFLSILAWHAGGEAGSREGREMQVLGATGWTDVPPAGKGERRWVGHCYGLNCLPQKLIC